MANGRGRGIRVRPVRIGILAASRIASPALVASARDNDRVVIGAVGSRSMERAEAFASSYDIPVAYGSYEDLLGDDMLDAIYISNPASLHAKWSMAALKAGKHVLCEKPIAGNSHDAKKMFEVSAETGRVLMEAFHWRFHPFADRMIAEVSRLRHPVKIETEFSIPQIPKTDIRYQLQLGGGALMDLGCYPIHWVRTLLGEPSSISAEMVATVPGVDDTVAGTMRFSDGSRADIRASMSGAETTRILTATAGNGTVEAINPLHPHEGNRLSWEIDGLEGREEIPGPTTYAAQLQSFVELIEDGGAQVVTPDDSMANMEVIDAMYRSAGLQPRP